MNTNEIRSIDAAQEAAEAKQPHKVVRTTEIREGLIHVEYDHGHTLSIGSGKGHYSSNLFDGFVPLSYEVAVLDPDGEFVQLTEYDDVAGHVSIEKLEAIASRLTSPSFDPHDLELYFD